MCASFDPCDFWFGGARSGGTACVLGGSHVAIIWQSVHVTLVMLWRAGAEAKGEEEEGHFSRYRIYRLDTPQVRLYLLVKAHYHRQ